MNLNRQYIYIVVSLVFNASCAAFPAQSAPALKLMQPGDVAVKDSDLDDKVVHLLGRLKEKPAVEQSGAYQRLLFEVSDTIETLAMHKDYAQALLLAETKLQASKASYSAMSAPSLDGLQDLIFLAAQQNDGPRFKQLLSEYGVTAARMRAEGRADEVNAAEKLRKRRLEAKAEAAMQDLLKPL